MTDTLFWTQCNPNITFENTAKKFYGKFLYKLVLYAPGGRLIASNGDLNEELIFRKNFNYNHGGSWWSHRYNTTLNDANIPLLENLRKLKNANVPELKIRIEEPRIQLYSSSVNTLKHVVQTYLQNAPQSYFETLCRPANDDAAAVLNSGAILRKNDIGYRYKVVLRDGHYPQEVKASLLAYLENLNVEQVRVPRGSYTMLSNPGYFWGCYIYVNDLSITTAIRLICPEIIANSHELVVVPHK